jgi:hypothetical protein
MVDFVSKGHMLAGRWLNLSTRAAMVSVTLLNATTSFLWPFILTCPSKVGFDVFPPKG